MTLEQTLRLCEQYKVSAIEFYDDCVVKRIEFADTVTIGEPSVVPTVEESDDQGDEGYNRALDRMSGKTGEKP